MTLTENQIAALGQAIAKAIADNLPSDIADRRPVPKEMRDKAAASADLEIAWRVMDDTPVLVRTVADDTPRRGEFVTRFYVGDDVIESETPQKFLAQFGADANRYRWERDNGRLREAGYILCP